MVLKETNLLVNAGDKKTGFMPGLGRSPATHSSILFPEESNGPTSLAGYSAWGLKESDITEATQQAHTHTHQDEVGSNQGMQDGSISTNQWDTPHKHIGNLKLYDHLKG